MRFSSRNLESLKANNMANGSDELVFAPLGGLGEIGMNAALYGFGPANKRKWIMVDCGVAFAGPELPGVDLILPDIGFIEKHKGDLLGLIITHAHEDHVAALSELRTLFPKARLHSGSKSAPVDQRNRPNDFIHLGSLRITHRDTPGHAEDGTTYIIGTWPDDAPHVAIVGDAVFAGSIGRGNQSWELARQKVREQILTLPPETLLCPGHGPLTTVAEEKAHNPFF